MMTLPPAQPFSFGDMACSVQRGNGRIAQVCCDLAGYCSGAVTNHRGVILTPGGTPCLVELTLDPTTGCYVGTICGIEKTVC